jgi:hypothetical protein
MPITIRELLASDTISQAADKINFNFDQLLLNGGGPQGPQGPQGPPGPIGGRGIRGSVWYEDTSTTSPGNNPNTVPPTLTPEDEDNYLQFNGVVWTYDASIPGWVNTGVNIRGPVGPPGASGKFAEYEASPSYGPAGDTTIFPDEISLSPIGLTQGVRSVLIGGFPEGPAFTPTSIGTNIVPLAIANQLQMPDISMMVHQFNASGRGIVFHGGDTTENFEQGVATDLSSIGIFNDDLMLISVPKAPTLASVEADLDGLRILTPSRNQHLQAGKRIWLQAGTSSTQYGAGDLASVWIEAERNNSSIASPTIELRVNDTAAPAYEAELRLGGFNTAPGTSSKQGDFWVEAGLIDILSNGNTTVNSGQGITMNAVNNIVATSSGADIRLNAPSGELYSTSQTVDVNATTSIDIDAGTDIDINASSTIDMIGIGLVTVQSTGNNLNLWATAGTSLVDVYSGNNVDVHAKDGNVHIFTGTAGGDVLIDTSNTSSQIKLETAGSPAPINLLTVGIKSDIKLETTGGDGPIEFITGAVDSPIVLDANNGGAIPANIGQLGSVAYSLLRSQGNFYIGAGSGTYAFAAATFSGNKIVLEAQDDVILQAANDIILKHGSGDEVLIQPTSGGPVVNLKPASGSATSDINIFHEAAGGNSNLLLRSNNTVDEGQVAVSPGMSLRLAGGNIAGDQVIVNAYKSGSDLVPATDEPTFKVDANIHYSGSGVAGQVTVNRDEDIFSSGQIPSAAGANAANLSMSSVKWLRVGNVVHLSGKITNPSGNTSTYDGFILPVVDGTGNAYNLNGVATFNNSTMSPSGKPDANSTGVESGTTPGTFKLFPVPQPAILAGTITFIATYTLVS